MSKFDKNQPRVPATDKQAAHTLTLLTGLELDRDNYVTLHDGLLSNLVKAIKLGTIDKVTPEFLRALGLYKAFKFGDSFTLKLDQKHQPWNNWQGISDLDYRNSFNQQPSNEVEECRASLYYFPIDVTRAEAALAIAAVHTGPWMFGHFSHLLTLAGQMYVQFDTVKLSVTSFSYSIGKEAKATITTYAAGGFMGGTVMYEDNILPANTYVLVIDAK